MGADDRGRADVLGAPAERWLACGDSMSQDVGEGKPVAHVAGSVVRVRTLGGTGRPDATGARTGSVFAQRCDARTMVQ